ncbi:MAG: hypothetical protein HY718_19595 [Planctomycetes bacterium]|nr:hypothetical protein [Planctomycetota bacterium]
MPAGSLLVRVIACAAGTLGWACIPVDTGDGSGTPRPPPTGYVAVLFINHSAKLVQDIISVENEGLSPQVWVTPVTPESWDALLFDYPLNRIRVLAVTPVDIDTGQEGDQVQYAGGPFTDADHITCGSLIVVETSDGGAGGPAVIISVRTLPDTADVRVDPVSRSARAPGAASGLTLVRPQVPEGLAADVNATWENGDGEVFASSWRVNGVGSTTAALVECPVTRIGWGNLRDRTLPGARVVDLAVDIDAPTALVSADIADGDSATFTCGDAVILDLLRDAEAAGGFRLDLRATSSGSSVPSGAIDLFGNIRQVVDDAGLAGRLSNTSLLLPIPAEPPAG